MSHHFHTINWLTATVFALVCASCFGFAEAYANPPAFSSTSEGMVTVKGRAVNFYTGEGVGDLRARHSFVRRGGTLDAPDPQDGEVLSNPDGTFEVAVHPRAGSNSRIAATFAVYPPDGYMVVEDDGSESLKKIVLIHLNRDELRNPDHVETVRLAPTVEREIRVYEPDGRTAADGASITFEPGTSLFVRPPQAVTVAAREGADIPLEIVHASGYALSSMKFDRALQSQPAVFVLKEGGTVAGTVTDHEGRPVERARVSASTGPRWMRSARTDETGSYVLSHLPDGASTVWLSLSPGATEGGRPLPLRAIIEDANTVAGLDFVVSDVIALQGVVKDAETGLPVEGANVSVTVDGMQHHSSTTGEDGAFKVGNVSSDATILGIAVMAENYAAKHRPYVAASDFPMEFALERTRPLALRVSDSQTGRPVTHYNVNWTPLVEDPNDQGALHRLTREEVRDESGECIFAKASGTIGLLNIQGGDSDPEFARAVASRVLLLESLEPGTVVDVQLSNNSSINGVVRNAETNEPVPGAAVSLSGWYDEDGQRIQMQRPYPETTSNDFGEFSISQLSPVEYGLSITTPGYIDSHVTVDASTSSSTELPQTPVAPIMVMLVDSDGEPVENAHVWAYADAGGGKMFRAGARSDAQGVAHLDGIPHGVYDVQVNSSDHARLRVERELPDPQHGTVHLELEEGVQVTGNIAGPPELLSTSGYIRFTGENGVYTASNRTSSSYRIRLAPGSYEVTYAFGQSPPIPVPGARLVVDAPEGAVSHDIDVSNFQAVTIRPIIPRGAHANFAYPSTLTLTNRETGWSAERTGQMLRPMKIGVPPGLYDVSIELDDLPGRPTPEHLALSEPFEVNPGEPLEVSVPMEFF